MQLDLSSVDVRALAADPRVQAIAAIALAAYTLAWCRIFARAGFHGAWGLAMLLPGINVFMLLGLAFGPWPLMTEVRSLRKMDRSIQKTASRRMQQAA